MVITLMKKRIVIFFLTILALALISAFFFPAGTKPEVRQYYQDCTAMKVEPKTLFDLGYTWNYYWR